MTTQPLTALPPRLPLLLPGDERDSQLRELREQLETAWDTAGAPSEYGAGSVSAGQCVPTALVVQDRFGGTLLRAEAPGGSHYYNRLPDCTLVDLTRDQFADGDQLGEPAERSRESVLAGGTVQTRYDALRARLS